MAETYLQLAQQIEELQHRAAAVKEQEMAEVIERIRLAIKAYGLTADQLFGVSRTAGGNSKATAKRTGRKSSGARFKDDSGNVWSGRGPRPRWLKAALESGRTLQDFAVASGDSSGPARGAASKAASVVKFRDGAGNSWSGRGPKPGWFKAAIAGGKKVEELAA